MDRSRLLTFLWRISLTFLKFSLFSTREPGLKTSMRAANSIKFEWILLKIFVSNPDHYFLIEFKVFCSFIALSGCKFVNILCFTRGFWTKAVIPRIVRIYNFTQVCFWEPQSMGTSWAKQLFAARGRIKLHFPIFLQKMWMTPLWPFYINGYRTGSKRCIRSKYELYPLSTHEMAMKNTHPIFFLTFVQT